MSSALTVAKYIVNRCVKSDTPISNMQLQKILYFVQIAFLKKLDKPCFSDDIEAWKFGPVIPAVYYYFCGFGAMPIWSSYKVGSVSHSEIIDQVVDEKKQMNPWDLIAESHYKGSPWNLIYQDGQGSHKVIPLELMRNAAR